MSIAQRKDFFKVQTNSKLLILIKNNLSPLSVQSKLILSLIDILIIPPKHRDWSLNPDQPTYV
jgi:hypothetical protein